MAILAQSEVEKLMKMGCDGKKCILVERELLLDVSEHSVGVCVVYGGSDGHGESAKRATPPLSERWPSMGSSSWTRQT
jgi:hypothetical protein